MIAIEGYDPFSSSSLQKILRLLPNKIQSMNVDHEWESHQPNVIYANNEDFPRESGSQAGSSKKRGTLASFVEWFASAPVQGDVCAVDPWSPISLTISSRGRTQRHTIYPYGLRSLWHSNAFQEYHSFELQQVNWWSRASSLEWFFVLSLWVAL